MLAFTFGERGWNGSRFCAVSRDCVGPPMIDWSLRVFLEWGFIAGCFA